MKGLQLIVIALVTAGFSFGQGFFELFGAGPSPEGVDLSGSWTLTANQDANLGTAAGAVADFGGIPINEASRIYALSWTASRMTVRQEQCAGYVPPYFYYDIGNFRFWQERDPHTQSLVAIKMYGQITEGTRTIWMDGRPHPPPYAAHTWAGFSTGKWEGNVLSISTDHIKRGFVRANGLVQTDDATLREHFIRHGDLITYFAVTTDPAYLAEPLSKTVTMQRFNRDPNAWLYACDDGEQILDRAPDQIPNYLFGQNPFLREFATKNQVPLVGALGGPETMYPEFKTKVKDAAATDAAGMAEVLPRGPARGRVAPDPTPHDGEIHVLPVQGNVYMLVGDGANIAVQIGDEGAMVVDSGTGTLADKIIDAVRKLSSKPITFIVNTSFHGDHVGGNVKLRAAGYDPSTEGSFFSGQFGDAGRGATIIANLNVQYRLSAPDAQVKVASEGWPSDTYVRGRRRKFFNDEGIDIFYMPNAITDGDSIVQFRHSEVIATGDIFNTTQYPFIDVKNGGSIQGEIDALNAILDKTVYKHDEEGGTYIIPGHGRLCDEYDVAEYREMLAIVRDRVRAMIRQGATLDQVKAAKLTFDYDPLYGATSGPWTTDMFVEAVYTSLKQPPPAAAK